jgi:hypothetical protein
MIPESNLSSSDDRLHSSIYTLFTFRKIRINASRIFVAPIAPKNITFTSLARKKKFHPAAWIFRSREKPSRALTTLQFSKYGSLSKART